MASVKGITILQAAAGVAKPSPKLGQALGPLGVNMMVRVASSARAKRGEDALRPRPRGAEFALMPAIRNSVQEFCKQFNDKTEHYSPAAVMRVRLTAFEDRTFAFEVLPPGTSWFLKRVTGVTKGSAGAEKVGTVSVKALYELAKSKQKYDPTMASLPLESITKSVMGSAETMGLEVTR